jgi:hypothetical protein
MKKYNTQKHTQGRINNALKHEQNNIVYDIMNDDDYHISIDSRFKVYQWEDNIPFKEVYANIYNQKIVLCKITEDVELNNDFYEEIIKLYDICRNERVKIENNHIILNVVPSSYNASDIISVNNNGIIFEIAKYKMYQYEYCKDDEFFIFGHSTYLGVTENEGLSLNLIKNMSHFEFYRYFQILKSY